MAKQRIQTECEKSGALCWITPDCREIENCLPVAVIEAAYPQFAEHAVSLNNLSAACARWSMPW